MPRLIKFPHIDQLRHVVEDVRRRATYHSVDLPTLTFRGTVKLHGTNASICRDVVTGETWCQSREMIITPEADNMGFARFVEQNPKSFNYLFNLYAEGLEDGVLTIYGEWCGKGIMKGVGINQLDKMFVVFGIKFTPPVETLPWIDIKVREPSVRQHIIGRNAEFNTWQESWMEAGPEPLGTMTHWVPVDDATGTWLNSAFTNIDPDLALDMKGCRIFDINEFPSYEIKIDFKNADASVEELVNLTNGVEASCPVARAFDVIGGVGEGIVWTCTQSWYHDGGVIRTEDLLFKTKGLKHKETAHDKPSADPEKVANVQKFVEGVATEHRFEKMLEKLEIAGVTVKPETTGQFLKLVGEDIIREEGDVLVASGLDRKDAMGSVNNVAKKWWMALINSRPM